MDLSFYSAESGPKIPKTLIVGANRSGKTLLGNLLGSCLNVEHIDEPWLLIQLTHMAANGLIPESFAGRMFQTYLYELINDRMLMRHANFRPSDLSYIRKQKTSEEIFTRLMTLKSRDDVRHYLNENSTSLVVTLTNTGPFCSFLERVITGVRILYVVRDGFEVALEVVKKGWLSDRELINPQHSNLYYPYTQTETGKIFYLPFWVELEKAELFAQWSEFARSLYYWRCQMELGRDLRERLEKSGKMKVVHFSRLTGNPNGCLKTLTEWLGFASTNCTEALIAQIKEGPRSEIPDGYLERVDKKELEAVYALHQEWGLPVDAFHKDTGKIVSSSLREDTQ